MRKFALAALVALFVGLHGAPTHAAVAHATAKVVKVSAKAAAKSAKAGAKSVVWVVKGVGKVVR